MSNPLKKTMVYLGLADEEEVYRRARAAAARTASATRRREGCPGDAAAPSRPPCASPRRRAISEILTVHPKQYRDAQVIAENFREGIPVIINLSQMSDADARRLIDFASGLSLGLYGRIERVTSKVFLLSPENVAVSGDGGGRAGRPGVGALRAVVACIRGTSLGAHRRRSSTVCCCCTSSCCWRGSSSSTSRSSTGNGVPGAPVSSAPKSSTRVTDPPIRLFRRFIPPLRIGADRDRLRLRAHDAPVLHPAERHARIHRRRASPRTGRLSTRSRRARTMLAWYDRRLSRGIAPSDIGQRPERSKEEPPWH